MKKTGLSILFVLFGLSVFGQFGFYSGMNIPPSDIRTFDLSGGKVYYDQILPWMLLPYFTLPENGVALIVDDSVTVYGDALINVPIINNLSVDYICDIGIDVGNNMCIRPSISDTGDHILICKFYNYSYLYHTDTIIITVYAKAPQTKKKIILVGDSTMGGGTIELNSDTLLGDTAFVFLGTIGITEKTEGYAGSSWYGFNTGTHGKFFKTDRINLPAYFADYSIDTPDYVYVRLGINDTFKDCYVTDDGLTDSDIAIVINNAKTLIDSFLIINDTIRLILGIPTISENTGNGWNANYDESIGIHDVYINNIHKYWKAIIDTFANGEYDQRVDCSYEAIFLNRDDGYPKVDGIHSNGVHPSVYGYNQIARGVSAYLNKQLYKDLKPDSFAVTWVNDFAELTWVDKTLGQSSFEIWESKNAGTYELSSTTAIGAEIDSVYTWQGAEISFKIRAKYGTWYSEFTEPISINTPLVFKTDQTTLTDVVINQLSINDGYTVNINWGDGTNNDYTGNNVNITKSYSSENNPYYVQILSNNGAIKSLSIASQLKSYGELTNWHIPDSLTALNLSGCLFTGNPGNWTLPEKITSLQIQGSRFTGNIGTLKIPSLLTYIAIAGSATYYMTGDLSNESFAEGTTRFYADNNKLTGIPRGAYKNFDSTIGMSAYKAALSQSEIDSILVYIDNYFTINTPIQDCKFVLSGTGNAPPSATGLAAKSSIEAKFTAAGFTATITVNP